MGHLTVIQCLSDLTIFIPFKQFNICRQTVGGRTHVVRLQHSEGVNASSCAALAWRFVFDLSLRSKINSLGKVHGSLARAGKVRAQTPKVEKQEKKKKKRGT